MIARKRLVNKKRLEKLWINNKKYYLKTIIGKYKIKICGDGSSLIKIFILGSKEHNRWSFLGYDTILRPLPKQMITMN